MGDPVFLRQTIVLHNEYVVKKILFTNAEFFIPSIVYIIGNGMFTNCKQLGNIELSKANKFLQVKWERN